MPTKTEYLKWTVKQLTDEIRKRELKGYSKFNKDEKAQMLAANDKKGKGSEPGVRAVTPPRRKIVTPRSKKIDTPRRKEKEEISLPHKAAILQQIRTEQRRLDSELLKISKKGYSPEKVKSLIAKGANVNAFDRTGSPVLINAVKKADVKMVDILISNGANVNIIDDTNNTALLIAAEAGNREIVKKLIDVKANVRAADKNGTTVLMHAVWKGDKRMVEMLIDKGADVNPSDDFRNTALTIAAGNGQSEIVEILIGEGANVNVATHQGITPLIGAIESPHRSKNIRIVRSLIAAGAKVDDVDKYGKTALMYGVEYGSKEIVKIIIDANPDVNISDNEEGNTALMYAALWDEDEIEIIKTLIGAKADVNLTNRDGQTALMLAAEGGHRRMVEELIRGGTNLEAVDNKERNARELWPRTKQDFDEIVSRASEKIIKAARRSPRRSQSPSSSPN